MRSIQGSITSGFGVWKVIRSRPSPFKNSKTGHCSSDKADGSDAPETSFVPSCKWIVTGRLSERNSKTSVGLFFTDIDTRILYHSDLVTRTTSKTQSFPIIVALDKNREEVDIWTSRL